MAPDVDIAGKGHLWMGTSYRGRNATGPGMPDSRVAKKVIRLFYFFAYAESGAELTPTLQK